ncbi:MAG: GNAT family N-acetyltransferase [Acidobacteriota bacterium]|jgi:GNAT superfamily N-acetyltransferase
MPEKDRESTKAPVQIPDGLSVGALSARERYRRWRFNSTDPDRFELWPGFRFLISELIHGSKSIVVGATVDGGRLLVARTKISRSLVSRELWHSGYTVTIPEYRGKGIGRLLMQAELEQVTRFGGRFCDGYIARDNIASIRMCEGLGFRPLPFIRVHCQAKSPPATNRLKISPLRCFDLRSFLPGLSSMEKTAGAKWIVVLAEEFVRCRQLLPWKRPTHGLYEIVWDGQTTGFARCGSGHVNFIFDPETLLEGGLKIVEGVVGALSEMGQTRKAFLFVNKDLWDQIAGATFAANFDFVYLWEPKSTAHHPGG